MDLDGYFKLDITKEGVFLSVYSPMGKGEKVDLDNVMAQIDLAGLIGIDNAAVEKAVNEAVGQPVKIGEGVVKKEPRGLKDYVKLEVAKDKMAASITLTNHKDGMLPRLEVEEIKDFLLRGGVVYGIDEEAIAGALSEGIVDKPIQVAKGVQPTSGKDTVIEVKFKKDRTGLVQKADGNGKVDYRELGLIVNVSPGEVLAVKTPAVKGIPGKTVTGDEVRAKEGKDIPMPAGKNTLLSEDGLELTAASPGNVVWTGSHIAVDTTYEVKGDVDMTVGNIDFVGDVVISGAVREGFVVKAGESIDIAGTVERATLSAGKDIRIQRGIVGCGEGSIYAGGNITATFIEMGNIEARGDVVVTEDIMHSNIDAGGSVFCFSGKRGRIMGGRIRAGGEVCAKRIGSWVEVPTEIESGIDPRVRQELMNLEEKVEKEKHDFDQLKLSIKTLSDQKKKAGALAADKEEALLQHLQTQNELMASLREDTIKISTLKEKLAESTGGKISVAEILYPGVKLWIKNTPMRVEVEYRYCALVERANKISFRTYEEPGKKKKKLGSKKWERGSN
ncbi:MAG: FapA family protein [bacterium]|nr:FapA family protein [bacterium]